MRTARRILLASLGIAALLTLFGCVYLRLLEVKSQLRDFDAHFTTGGRPSWHVEFKNPVLTAKDAIFMIGAPPLSISTGTGEDIYHFEFEMVRSTPAVPTALERLSLQLHLKEKMLLRIEAPETFLLYFSRRVLEETLRQAKDAEVFQLERTARATVRLSKDADAELPSLERTRLLLGEPMESRKDGPLWPLTYRYRIVGDKREKPAIAARLTFLPDGSMIRAVISWGISTVDATFPRE